MRTINRIILLGEMAESPTMSVEGGVKVARFTLETIRRYRLSSGRPTETVESHQCVARDRDGNAKLAGIVERMGSAGRRYYIDGRLVFDEAGTAQVEVGEFVWCGDPERSGA